MPTGYTEGILSGLGKKLREVSDQFDIMSE
jgi:hypothetical protein